MSKTLFRGSLSVLATGLSMFATAAGDPKIAPGAVHPITQKEFPSGHHRSWTGSDDDRKSDLHIKQFTPDLGDGPRRDVPIRAANIYLDAMYACGQKPVFD